MNSLAQLVSDMDLDEAMVLRRLKESGLAVDCWSVADVLESDCQAAIDLVMEVLKADCVRALEICRGR